MRKVAEKHEIIMDACIALSHGEREESLEIIRKHYPFDARALPRQVPRPSGIIVEDKVEVWRHWHENFALKMRVFCRDGFINRFTGELLIFPAVLGLLSKEFPADFPYQQAWELGEVHIAYYDLGACASKLLLPSRGGSEAEDNLITTTMPYVLARGNCTVEEVGWRLTRVGYVEEWDGMSTWYVEYVNDHPEIRNLNFFNQWYNAAKQTLGL